MPRFIARIVSYNKQILACLARHFILGFYDNGMKIMNYSTLEQAFRETMVEDIDHVLIRHSYERGVNIVPHVHVDADEYVIAREGHFFVTSEDFREEFILDGGSVTVIFYPAGRMHGLRVLGDQLDYFVLRAPKY